MSKAIFVTLESRSKASPERISMPCFAAFAIPAITAVGVARIKAQGQKTTSTVTARMNSPVIIHVPAAHKRAMTTSQVAHLSARLTMGALFSSASRARRIMRCRELSAQRAVAFMVVELHLPFSSPVKSIFYQSQVIQVIHCAYRDFLYLPKLLVVRYEYGAIACYCRCQVQRIKCLEAFILCADFCRLQSDIFVNGNNLNIHSLQKKVKI